MLLSRVGEIAAEMDAAAYLVGGPVRDLLLGRAAPDLDVAVEGPVIEITEALAEHLGAQVRKTTEFMTSTLVLDDGMELDIARTRTETYPEPGALPVVAPATLADDLGRRDFTVNAMAMCLQPKRFGELIDPFGGKRDLEGAQLRVLHDRSFEDDPTRMLRAVRFMLRLGFELEGRTAELMRSAINERRLTDISGARIRNELAWIFAEAPSRSLTMLHELGLLRAMGLAPASDAACDATGRVVRAAGELGYWASGVDLLVSCLGIYAGLSDQDAGELAQRLMLDATARDVLIQAASLVSDPPSVLACETRCSDTFCALCRLRPEAAVAVWTVLDEEGRERLEHYWRHLRGACADIDGSDLIEAGHEPGPRFSDALEAALVAKLDEGADREEQLAVALSVLEDSPS